MTILAFLVFGATLAACAGTVFATLRGNGARIVELLMRGPMPASSYPAPAPLRADRRGIMVRRGLRPVTKRAAA